MIHWCIFRKMGLYKMKKIGVITFHSAENSGAALQCIALQKAIEKIGGDPYVIDYQPDFIKKQYRIIINPFFEAKKKDVNRKQYLKSVLAYTLQNIHFNRKLSRKKKFKQFRDMNMRLSDRYSTLDELRQNPPNADIYIAGSDQIWNSSLTGGELDPAFFLTFGDSEVQRFTYAISVGKKLTKEEMKRIYEAAYLIDVISFREKINFNQFNGEYRTKIIRQSVDPTLLINKEDWCNLVRKNINKEPYILVYALEKNDAFKNIIKKIREETGYSVIDISQCNLHLKKIQERKMDFAPDEFLTYIYNSSLVITNSFHCTVFSIIFHKDFITVPHKKSNERLSDLLNNLKLEDHFYNKETSFMLKTVNWELVDNNIDSYRLDSIEYLKSIIK